MIESFYVLIFHGIQELRSYPHSHRMGSICWREWEWRRASVWSLWSHKTPTWVHVWDLMKKEEPDSLIFSWPLVLSCSLFLSARVTHLEVTCTSCPYIYLLHTQMILPCIWELRKCRSLIRKPLGSDTRVKKSFLYHLEGVAAWITQMIKRRVQILVLLFYIDFFV